MCGARRSRRSLHAALTALVLMTLAALTALMLMTLAALTALVLMALAALAARGARFARAYAIM